VAIVEAISSTDLIVPLIDEIVSTALLVALWIAVIYEPMSSVAFAV
jgi:hypothetical protein